MNVIFISQCQKKALNRTRKVLDAYANRIGDNAWQTAITEEGLIMVRKLLRQTASKNTAVSCHRITTRKRTELEWIVGNRQAFNESGFVPVNRTKKSIIRNDWENDWHYLPAIKALVAISALLHDLGKASDLFQEKLSENSRQADPLRHEWVSCLLLKAIVQLSGDNKNDTAWLTQLSQMWQPENIVNIIQSFKNQTAIKLGDLPPLASLVAWLIVSHHKLPILKDKEDLSFYENSPVAIQTLNELLNEIDETWGYAKTDDKRLEKCFNFSQTLLTNSQKWQSQLKKWAKRLLSEQNHISETLNNGSWRILLHHARLCLMLGDHYYSSCERDEQWQNTHSLLANTSHYQQLDEHLFYVNKYALQASQSLAYFDNKMNRAHDIRSLKEKSPKGFEWQDKAVQKIKEYKQAHQISGAFIVNMASTGKGKTIANAKIMQALSDDESLRYILALGLRTLTLQTGDVYRQVLKLDKSELAILIGSKAVQELHENAQNNAENDFQTWQTTGSESQESLLDNELDFDEMPSADFLNALFHQKNKDSKKQKAFLYQPILVCTIDHLMSATETKRGGKYILPCLRLLSSDLVIDEVDDFGADDFIAIARLVHLAGMLGRKVMISSATIPPDLACGLFKAYQMGFGLYCQFKKHHQASVLAMWTDEFSSQCEYLTLHQNIQTDYNNHHQKFIQNRVAKLSKVSIKQLAYLVECDDILTQKETGSPKQKEQSKRLAYFERMREQIAPLHHNHAQIDPKTGKKFSFGVIRVANIAPCVLLSQYLMDCDWQDDIDIKIMCYHSRQVLLLRNHQERHLDSVLNRKCKDNEPIPALNNPIIRHHLDNSEKSHIIFVLVATPVEEVGRDHDFDWAIIEPSSYRSIIQLAGRVLRHRNICVDTTNIAIMQYNLLALYQRKVAYHRPGFEKNTKKFRFENKDLSKLIPDLDKPLPINAIARIDKAKTLKPTEKFADLEHAVIARIFNNDDYGAGTLNGWLNETWFLTALPQMFNGFRVGAGNIRLFACVEKPILDYEVIFKEKQNDGYIKVEKTFNIHRYELTERQKQRLWLNRDYLEIVLALSQKQDDEFNEEKTVNLLSKRYGELTIAEYDLGKSFYYHDEFGLWVRDDRS